MGVQQREDAPAVQQDLSADVCLRTRRFIEQHEGSWRHQRYASTEIIIPSELNCPQTHRWCFPVCAQQHVCNQCVLKSCGPWSGSDWLMLASQLGMFALGGVRNCDGSSVCIATDSFAPLSWFSQQFWLIPSSMWCPSMARTPSSSGRWRKAWTGLSLLSLEKATRLM